MTAALFHVQFDMVQRSRGQSAVKVAAYNAAAQFDAGDGTSFDFRRKVAEHQGHAVLLPAGAPAWAADAAELWRRAEAAERRGDAQPALLVEFSIPRVVPAEQRMDFARAVIQPLVDDGMAAQLDLHCVTAADGQEQPHAHVVLSMRRFDGGTFATTKNRKWNAAFHAEKGRTMRAEIAGRMNSWMVDHQIDAAVDHRRAVDRGDDVPPERNVSRALVEAWKNRPDSDAAVPFSEVLQQREARHRLRAAQRAATAWSGEARRLDGALRAIEARTPGARRPGRRRDVPPWNPAWTPVEGDPHFASCEVRGRSAMLSLAGGGAIIDRGDALLMKGRVSDAALAAMAEQAARHGWSEVELTGDAIFRDKLAAAMQLRGIQTVNHGPASRLALRQAERALAAERAATMPKPAPAAPVRQAVPVRPRPVELPQEAATPAYAPAYRPRWASAPQKPDTTKRQ